MEFESSVSVKVFLFLFLGVAFSTSYAGDSATPQISAAELQTLAIRASFGSDFKVAANALVLERLNWFLNAERGQQYVEDSWLNYKSVYGRILEEKAKLHGVPVELAFAIPMKECQFRNCRSKNGTGLFGLTKKTALMMGLKVEKTPKLKNQKKKDKTKEAKKKNEIKICTARDARYDERCDPEKAADAALKYLRKLYDLPEIKDWGLALKAYNVGDGELGERMKKHKMTRDLTILDWEKEPEKRYASAVMALVIVIKNSENLSSESSQPVAIQD